ncbi:DUF4183 domain-containing protein [Paenibacillus sp. EC2-1]|uniref:DUF4183 domain-containing protein n=1 Tax=Paenibacillus sp. EC2-1 TaxID=3388665 RepID=UPI003BEF140B
MKLGCKKKHTQKRKRKCLPSKKVILIYRKIRFNKIVIVPNIQRFFHETKTDISIDEPLTISAHEFTDDQGRPVKFFSNIRSHSHTNLFINGMLQEGRIYKVSPHNLIIHSVGNQIIAGTPIIIEVLSFSARIVS